MIVILNLYKRLAARSGHIAFLRDGTRRKSFDGDPKKKGSPKSSMLL